MMTASTERLNNILKSIRNWSITGSLTVFSSVERAPITQDNSLPGDF